MFTYFLDPNVWVSMVAIIISIVALFQTRNQIKISNKQCLYDRRLEKIILFRELKILYEQNQILLKDRKGLLQVVDYPFMWLTNCSLLENMNLAMKNPLHKDEQKQFLYKCEVLEKAAVEMELLWKDKIGVEVSSYIRKYKELLQAMYKQQVFLTELRKENMEQPMTLEKFEEQSKKNAKMVNLFKTIDDLQIIYKNIVDDKIEEKMIKSLTL